MSEDQVDWLEEELSTSMAQLPDDDKLLQVSQMVREMMEYDDLEKDYTERAKQAGKRKRYYSEKAIPEALSALGLSGVTLDDGRKVTVTPEVYVDLNEENRGAAFQWMEDEGYGDLIKTQVACTFGRGEREHAQEVADLLSAAGYQAESKDTVHYQTLRAWAKDLLTQGVLLPDFFNAYLGSKTRVK
jgi:hypothetical protein